MPNLGLARQRAGQATDKMPADCRDGGSGPASAARCHVSEADLERAEERTLVEGDWRYLDVTTPLLRDQAGRDLLDADIFLAMLPWALRGVVKSYLLRDITGSYFDPRQAVLDVLANLLKERLEYHLPVALEVANRYLERALTSGEVHAYYARDARMWRLLLALRRLDRFWQLKVRRRGYPFLLPGKIER